MTRIEKVKRGLAAPLLFCALALAAAGSVDASSALWFGSLLWLWAAAAVIPSEARFPITALGIAVAALALWMVGTALFIHPYSAAAPYHAAFLFGGYLYGRRAASAADRMYFTALAFGIALAGWALWQLHAGSAQRAHGPFITPATFAAIINLVLLPALVIVALGSRRPALLAAIGVLGIALVASSSRGGWLAFFAAAAVALVFLHRAKLVIDRRAIAFVTGSLVLGLAAAAAWTYTALGTQGGSSFQSRLELYRLAVTGITPSTWLLGAGYDAFYYLLETSRILVPSYGSDTTYFVHNDYLQMLYAFGVPGLAALLYLVITPVAECWRKLPELPEKDRLIALAALAAILSMALHALVDFPFFVPLCVLLYGAALGTVDVMLVRGSAVPVQPRIEPAWRRGLTAAIATVAVWILALPVSAEAAAAFAERQWRKLDGERAAFWFEAARRLDARDWRYHWYAGQFWSAQAAVRSDAAAGRLADVALAAAIAANAREVRPLYSRIELHTRLRAALATPADAATVRAWADRAMTLAPTDSDARAMRERVFRQFPVR